MITINIITQKGLLTKQIPKETILSVITEEVQNNNRWLFINGLFTNLKDATQTQLESAIDITLTNELGGA